MKQSKKAKPAAVMTGLGKNIRALRVPTRKSRMPLTTDEQSKLAELMGREKKTYIKELQTKYYSGAKV